jgi:hypothetical protein
MSLFRKIELGGILYENLGTLIVNGNAFFKKQRRSERRERRSNAERATNCEALFLYKKTFAPTFLPTLRFGKSKGIER